MGIQKTYSLGEPLLNSKITNKVTKLSHPRTFLQASGYSRLMACITSCRNSLPSSPQLPSRARRAKSSRCPTRKKELDTRQVIAHGSKSVSPNHSSTAGSWWIFQLICRCDRDHHLKGMKWSIHSWNHRTEKVAEVSCNLPIQNDYSINWIRIYGFKYGGFSKSTHADFKLSSKLILTYMNPK